MSLNPYESPDTAGESPPPKPSRLRFTPIRVLALVVVVGVFAALYLLPNVRFAREAGRRSSCSNNLKHIAIALHNYQDEYHALPPAYTVDADGRPLHSWRTLILPYLEQQALYDKIDLAKPWDDPANQAAFETIPHTYRCPSASYPERHTAYLAVVAPGGCFRSTESRAFAEITDNRAITMMVVEVNSDRAIPWMSPVDASEEMILNRGASDKLPHPRGFHAMMVDASLRYLPADTKPATLRAMISIAGNDDNVAQSEY